jgi:hypothetical protein
VSPSVGLDFWRTEKSLHSAGIRTPDRPAPDHPIVATVVALTEQIFTRDYLAMEICWRDLRTERNLSSNVIYKSVPKTDMCKACITE